MQSVAMQCALPGHFFPPPDRPPPTVSGVVMRGGEEETAIALRSMGEENPRFERRSEETEVGKSLHSLLILPTFSSGDVEPGVEDGTTEPMVKGRTESMNCQVEIFPLSCENPPVTQTNSSLNDGTMGQSIRLTLSRPLPLLLVQQETAEAQAETPVLPLSDPLRELQSHPSNH